MTAAITMLSMAFGPSWTSAQVQSPGAQDLEFDVVSIRPATSAGRPDVPVGAVVLHPNGRVVMVSGRIHTLIWEAYQPIQGQEIIGEPDWLNTDRYDVEALAPRPVTREEMRLMLRRVLADRFKLQASYQLRDRPTYVLALARENGQLGAAMRRTENDCEAYRALRARQLEARAAAGSAAPVPREQAPNGAPLCDVLPVRGNIVSGGISMDRLAELLSGRIGAGD